MTDIIAVVEKLCGRKIENRKKKRKIELDTPILFLTFNRLDTTKRVFEEIRKAKPKELFIASDGWRNEEEREKVMEVRKYLSKSINWDCETNFFFRGDNLGCKKAVSSAIDWFFSHVDKGIILEDDCLPNSDFFKFCEEMLNLYEHENRVWSITGSNELGKFRTENSFLFSKYFFCWGWATWRNRWEKVDIDMNTLKGMSNYSINKTGLNSIEKFYFKNKFEDNLRKGQYGTWDISFLYSQLVNKKLQIVPKVNLVENIGMDSGSGNFNEVDKKYLNNKSRDLEFPISQPYIIERNKKFDRDYILFCFKRILNKRIGK